MVLVFNSNVTAPSSTEVATNSSLKGGSVDLGALTADYPEYKLDACHAIMASCMITQGKYKNCVSGTDACTWPEREIAKPVVDGSCDLIRKICGQNLDETLNKLYEAGALASSPELTTEIDHRIKALNRLKHEVRTVKSNAGAGSHKAIESKKPASAPSEVAKKENDSELEEDEPAV